MIPISTIPKNTIPNSEVYLKGVLLIKDLSNLDFFLDPY